MSHSASPLTRVAGFRAVGVTCGLKESGQPDLALILADRPCAAAAVFTKNGVKAAPVLYDMGLMARNGGQLQAVVVNAGNANAVTGEPGMADAAQMASLTEAACNLPADRAFVMSTGVIGHPLPMDRVEQGIREAAARITTEAGAAGENVAQAILTTDLVKKEAYVETSIAGRTITIGGIAKGSGMIHPQMGTMLSTIVTDANIEAEALNLALRQVVNRTFNRVTVDGDTSTNDTVVLLASGVVEQPRLTASGGEFDTFCAALTEVCTALAKAIARDGEGATKLLEITVRGAVDEAEAERGATTVANSPLVKTAFFGNDPNWGRLLMAVGRSGIQLNPQAIALWIGDYQLVAEGAPLPFDAADVSQWLTDHDTVPVVVEVGVGDAAATVWSCDFSYGYVEINAEYHT